MVPTSGQLDVKFVKLESKEIKHQQEKILGRGVSF